MLNSQPIVSVIIPVYGRSQQLEQAVQSVLNQAGLPDGAVELIVVDDASESPPSFSKDQRVTLICRKQNGGPAAARNVGIKAASGRFLAFLDSDDVWLPGKLATQISFLEKMSNQQDDALLIVGSGFYDPNRHTGELRARIPRDADNLQTFSSGCWFCPGSTLLMNRASFDLVGNQDENMRRLEDLDWFIRFGHHGGRYICTGALDVIIRPSGNAEFSAVMTATNQLTKKYARGGTMPLPPSARKRLAAYLALEKSLAHFSQNNFTAALRELFVTLFYKPRRRPALEAFWKETQEVPDEVNKLFTEMLAADEK